MASDTAKNTLWVLFLASIIVTSNYWTHELGMAFYDDTQNNGKVFDLLHSMTPDLSDYKAYNDIIVSATALSFLFIPKGMELFKEFAAKFILIMVIRALTTVSTILPKHEKCDATPRFSRYWRGQCYDKVFSGHTSFVLLATLIYLREGILGWPAFLGINLANITSIVLTRSHYTVDIVLAILITLLVYDGDYHIFTNWMKRIEGK
jgi:hypothetical protein